MKAFQFNQKGGKLEIAHVPIPQPGPSQVRVRVLSCGICHSDVASQYGGLGTSWPRTPGHEVAGIVDEVGAGVTDWKKGDYVGIGWFGENCNHCHPCKQDYWVNCKTVKATGDHVDGGYAEYLVAHERGLSRIPEGMDPNEAGPLMCAGITTFNALRNSGALPGDVVAISGVGGLGHLAVQFSRKMGFYTVALTRGADKVDLALKLGAHRAIDQSKEDAVKELAALGGAKIILATAPSASAIEELIPALALNGTVIMVAIVAESIKVNSLVLLVKNGSLKGWSSGDSRDSEDTLKFAKDNGVKPMIEVFPLDKAPEAYEFMLSNKARFRVVLKVADK